MRKKAVAQRTLLAKLQSLPPERLSEVEDFVDFLADRDRDRRLVAAAAQIAAPAFARVWDNADDAEYDDLPLR